MEAVRTIASKLARVGNRLRRQQITASWLWIGAGATLVAVVSPLVAATAPSIAGPVAAIAVLAASGTVLGLILAVWLARRRWSRAREVARFVGQVESDLSSDLLSAVELADTSAHPEFSPELVAALQERIAERLDTLDPAQMVPARRLRKPLAAAMAAAIAAGAVFFLAGPTLARGWDNLAGSTTPAPYDGAAMIRGPVVGDVEIELEFPAYTRRPTVKLPAASGDFRAMPGTIATLKTRALQRVIGASLVFGDGKPENGDREPVAMTVDDGALAATIKVTGADIYRFLVEEPGGSRRIEASGHEIEIEKDKAPMVELHTPADELDVSNQKRVELAYISTDDYGITKVELVWEVRGKKERRPLPLPEPGRRSAQSKYIWDLAEVDLPSGSSVPYHVEVSDNDTVSGPNIGKSKVYTLRVFSPRQRHESLLADQRKLFEKLLALLGNRLVVAAEDVDAHRALLKVTTDVVVDIGTIVSAIESDPMTSDELRAFLGGLRDRHDKIAKVERKIIDRISARRSSRKSTAKLEQQLGAADQTHVAALEDDVIALADWIDRQDLEGMLHISDEIKTHRERLKKLMAELKRTGDPAVRAEIERELRALEERLAELSRKSGQVRTDVLDQFVNRDAAQAQAEKGCLVEVRELLATGDADAAAAQMAKCSDQLEKSAEQMEKALAGLRDERFSDEQKEIAELMSSLADLAQDEDDLAGQIDQVYQKYVEQAADTIADEVKQNRAKLGKPIAALAKRLDKISDAALTPFAKEELDAVKARLDDVEKMLADGDLAEALAMSRRAEAGLESVAAELEADLDDGEPWNKNTPNALKDVEKAKSVAGKTTDALRKATPPPKDVMDRASRQKLGKLLNRQKAIRNRAAAVARKASAAKHLPPMLGPSVAGKLDAASKKMSAAEKRLRSVDPSGARHQAHEAADALRDLTQDTQRQIRNGMSRGRTTVDEPVRIPGAEEYKAPAELREDILEAMKKGGPTDYQDMIKHYYEELIK